MFGKVGLPFTTLLAKRENIILGWFSFSFMTFTTVMDSRAVKVIKHDVITLAIQEQFL
jgi:hypothetical protein